MAQARQFLARLDRGTSEFTFQTFDDTASKRTALAAHRHGKLDDVAPLLYAKQDERAGAFVTINRTDGKGRKAENVTHVRAVFLDLDGAPLTPVMESGLLPHMVVESSPGRFHAYWLCDDCSLSNFKIVQRALAHRFGGDASVSDLSRVMRLPGFSHFKGAAFRTRMLEGASRHGPPYPLAEIIAKLNLELGMANLPLNGVTPGAGKVFEGGRNSHLFACGRAMRAHNMPLTTIMPALMAMNANTCVPPLADSEVRVIAANVVKYADNAECQPNDAVRFGANTIVPEDFYAVLHQGMYLYWPTRDLWPSVSVTRQLGLHGRSQIDRERAVVQMVWHPGAPMILEGAVVADGAWIKQEGVRVINVYRAPALAGGDPAGATLWRDHLRFIYPDEADHIEAWLAHRIQYPGVKVNHALVLGGAQGVGKDTLLEPVKRAIGPWNWQEVTPGQMLGRFNGWAKAVIVRVNEARDLGDVDRFAFYDHSKTYIAAPPDVIRVDEKNLREHSVFNVMGVIITTNHRSDGIYLPADDRRHFVAWTERTKDEFPPGYWDALWKWYNSGGDVNVCAFLRSLDLSQFNAKAPPPRTAAWHAIVSSNSAPEDAELRDVIESAGDPNAITLVSLKNNALALGLEDLAIELADRKGRRALPHKLERVGYVPVRNPDATDGLFRVAGRRQAIYAKRTLSIADQIRAARRFSDEGSQYRQSRQ